MLTSVAAAEARLLETLTGCPVESDGEQVFLTDSDGTRAVDDLPADLKFAVPKSPRYRLLWEVDGVWVAKVEIQGKLRAARDAAALVRQWREEGVKRRVVYLAIEMPSDDGRVVSASHLALKLSSREKLDNSKHPA